MSTTTDTDRDRQSFAETAMRLGGKSEEEAQRMGAVDKADEQVESLFQQRYQMAHSPVHRAVWDGRVPLDLFQPPRRRGRESTSSWLSQCFRVPLSGAPPCLSRLPAPAAKQR